jgi:hypothetical protein
MTDYYAREFRVFGSPPIPIYVPLSRIAIDEPTVMVSGQLDKRAGIEDPEMVEWFLKQGRFAIFLDGANEIGAPLRQKLSGFIDRFSSNNYVCVSSQESYEEFSWLSAIALVVLDIQQVRKILSPSGPDPSVESFLSRVVEKSLDFYRVPQNLKFAEQIIKNGQEVPDTLLGLYEAVFGPIGSVWEASGHAEYRQLVFSRAFEMIEKKTSFFEDKDFVAPAEVRAELLRQKLLVRSGEFLLFQHDLLKAFLAGTHFVDNEVFKGDVWLSKIDQNWSSLLEFALLKMNEADRENVLFRILGSDRKMAGLLFRRISESQPELMNATSMGEFVIRFGEASLVAGV